MAFISEHKEWVLARDDLIYSITCLGFPDTIDGKTDLEFSIVHRFNLISDTHIDTTIRGVLDMKAGTDVVFAKRVIYQLTSGDGRTASHYIAILVNKLESVAVLSH